MSTTFSTIAAACAYSREHDQIAHVDFAGDGEDALKELKWCLYVGEEWDYVSTVDGLEFWACDPYADDVSKVTMCVYVTMVGS